MPFGDWVWLASDEDESRQRGGRQAGRHMEVTQARGSRRETERHKKHMSKDACKGGIVGEFLGRGLVHIHTKMLYLAALNQSRASNESPLIASRLSLC